MAGHVGGVQHLLQERENKDFLFELSQPSIAPCSVYATGPLRGGQRVQSTQTWAPLGGPRCCQMQRGLVLYLGLLRKFPIDTRNKISLWLSLISKKIKRSPPPNCCVYECFASRCRQFQPRFFSGKIFRLYQILVEGSPKLMLVPGPDRSLNGPVSWLYQIDICKNSKLMCC